MKPPASFFRFSVIALALGFTVLTIPAQARIDAMQLRLLEPYDQELRWDNIESAPAWLNGIEPVYDKDWQMHRVVLAPWQQTTIMLPAYESLRLYHPQQRLNGTELDVLISNGTGLAGKQALQRSTDGHSLVLSPQSPIPLLVHVARDRLQTDAFAVALFVSRKVPLKDIAPYRNWINPTARWCLLAQEPFALPELYTQLPARYKQTYQVTGPERLMLKNRLAYERQASTLIQDYRIRYWLDDGKGQELGLSTSAETSRIVTVNTQVQVVGREEQVYLEIPAGRHRLVLEADRPLYLQVLAQTENDYLFKALNKPLLPVEKIRQQGLLPNTGLVQESQAAQTLAQDNSHQAGGLAAANVLRQAALQRPDYPQELAEAEQLQGFRTFYRELLPSRKSSVLPQFMAYFLPQTLPAVHRPQSDAILADQHLAEALKRLGNAYFTRLDRVGPTHANEYQLPEQVTEGQVRVIVDERVCVQRLLRIAIDEQPAQDVWLRCGQESVPETFVRTLTDAALVNLQKRPDSKNVSVDALFSAHAQPAPIIPVSVYELPIPKGAHTLKIWQASEQKSWPVNIAVQYRAAKPFLLSEHSYLARLRDATAKGAFRQFLQRLKTENPTDLAQTATQQQLANEWLPLLRWLHAEHHLYQAAVAREPMRPATLAPQTVANASTLAKQAENQQHWLDALEYWGKAVNASEGSTRQQAQLAQARNLDKLGENYLAESLRKYLSLTADGSVAEQAIAQLNAAYQNQNDAAASLTLAAAMLVKHPTAAHSRLLLDALLQNGEYRLALLLGLSFVEQPPVESLLIAAYRLQWWQTYQWLLEKLPAHQQAFWQGLQAQQNGDYAAALKAWALPNLKPWHTHLQQGLQLRSQLAYLTPENAAGLYGQWAHWQQTYPGDTSWENALWHVQDYAGGDTYYAIERDVYGQAVRATPERPVVLGILGPVSLNLQIRPLHATGQADSVLDGWLDINDNGAAARFPYTNNRPAQGLDNTGADRWHVGTVVNLPYQVGAGWHELRISSTQALVSIAVQEQRPTLPLTIMPILQTATFAEMGLLSHAIHPNAPGKSGTKP